MADRYWVGGTANWDGTAGTKWATTSGGAGGAAIPTSTDNVFFDGASGANTVTIAAGNTGCANLDCTGFTGTLAGSAALTATGNPKFVAGMTLTYTGALTLNATGAQTITSGGKTLGPLTIDSNGGSYQLQDALTMGATRTLTLTRGTFNMNNKAVSVGLFDSNNTNTRSITSGGATMSLTASSGTLWNVPSPGALTLNDALQLAATDSGASSRQINHGQLGGDTETNTPSLNITAGSGAFSLITGGGSLKNVDFTGFSGSWSSGTVSIYGNLTLSAGMTVAAGAAVVTFVATSGTKTITSNGQTIDRPVTFNGVGGTWQLADALTLGSTRTLTLTNGTFNMNGKAASTGLFSSSNSNTRSITSGGATLTLTGNNATIWNMATATNFTLNDALQVDCTYSGSTGTRTFNLGGTAGGTEARSPNVKVSAGTDTFSLTAFAGNLDFTGFAGSWPVTGWVIVGDLLISAGMTLGSGTFSSTFGASSGTKTITSSGKTLDFPIIFGGVGGTYQLADNLTVGSSRTTTLQAGTLSLNGKTLSTGRFSASGSTARVLTFGASGKIATTDTTAATVFDCAASTNLTVNRTGGAIEIGGNTTNTRTFAGGSQSWPTVTFTNTTAGGRLDITGSNTFKSLSVSVPPQSIMCTAGTTQTIEDANGFPSGTPGNLVTIGSITAANHSLAKAGGGRIVSGYLSISRSQASPGSTWYAGTTSTNGGNNSGWNFTDPPSFPTGMMAAFRP